MKRPELLITNGLLAGKRFQVTESGLRLGRSSTNDIHIPDEELSRNHCFFEAIGEFGLRVTDLASANGTFYNGKAMGNEPVMLHAGDLIEAGTTVIKVIGENSQEPTRIDLGLGDKKGSSSKSASSKRSPLATVLWIVTILIVGAAMYILLMTPVAEREQTPRLIEDVDAKLKEMRYERVRADANGIFRYELTFSEDGVLSVVIDDIPKENRHLTKSMVLNDKAREQLSEILSFKAVRDIDREYIGVDSEPPVLDSYNLKIVYDTRARTIKVENTQEPEAFRAIREGLEAFSKNQLGVWAIQYSRDKLIELAEESVRLGKSKWEDREVKYGNLFESVAAFKEALFYLETVNPKPDCVQDARQGLENSSKELDRRYSDQRFLADRALNLSQWETAERELGVLLEMIPDRADERNREASAKLMDVSKRMKGGK